MSGNRIRIRFSWLVAGVIVIPALLVLDAYLYYPALLRSGTLSPNADSIGIPIYLSEIGAIILAPILLAYALPALWQYRSNASPLEWHRNMRWRLFFSILLYALPAFLMLLERLYALGQRLPAYEYIDFIVVVPLMIWLLMLRAAMAAPR